jgi:hypothetical protein
MQIVQASPQLIAAVHAILVASMAARLAIKGNDLNDDTAIIVALAQSGFGAASIAALRAKAADAARLLIKSKAH